MEAKLKRLFDYQKFQKHSRLELILSDAEARYEGGLCDDALEFVSAAGDPNPAVPSGPEDVQ